MIVRTYTMNKNTMLMIKKLMLPLLVLLSAAASAQPYKGRVYEDVNGNGSFDKADRPLKDVKVSDGLNVVKRQPTVLFPSPAMPTRVLCS